MADDTAATFLVLIRHGDAGDPLPTVELDARRPLSPRGRKQARRAGKALRRMGLAPCDVWTSRLRRASQTVTVALGACGAAPLVLRTSAMAPDADPERIAKALAKTPPAVSDREGPVLPPIPGALPPGDVRVAPAPGPRIVPVRWIVGHDPHLTRVLAHLLGTSPDALRLSKGAFAVVALDARGPAAGAGTLVCLVPADGLKAILRRKKRKKKSKPGKKPRPEKTEDV